MPLISYIDGPNRDIHLSIDSVGVDVHPIEIYREMRTLRATDEELRKYDVFLSSHGNDPKGGGKFTERYVKELSGTRIVPYDVSQILTVIGVVITDDGQEGIACFDRAPLSPTTQIDINYIPPQVEVVRAEAELAAIRQASFGGVVAYNATSGLAGTGNDADGTPIGTHKAPSNNITDATAIAVREGFESILVKDAMTLVNGDDVSGYLLKGENAISTFVTVDAGAITANTVFRDMILYDSDMAGAAYLDHCSVANIVGVSGYIENSILAYNIQLAGLTNIFIVDCKSGCVGLTSEIPVIDLANEEKHIAMRNWSGPVKFINSSNALTTACIDVGSGATVIIDASITEGEFIIRGSAKVVHTQTGNENIVKETTEEGVWISDNGVATISVMSSISDMITAMVTTGAMTAEQSTQLIDIWKVMGLDINNPLIVDDAANSRTAGVDLNQSIVTVGDATTVTRQP
tara:strand:- start:10524 stop:11909 length:1386 start_codon:yes stop_codon:yes gene_type:complete